MLAASSGGRSARLFSGREMRRATAGFARDRVLGCGGFGEVYKGVLDDGTEVAIKSAKIGNVKGVEQVLNEVKVLSQVRFDPPHRV
jgi:serine/threonine protein kinase